MNADYRDSHKHASKGAEYEQHYTCDPWARFVWSTEQRILDRILREHVSPAQLHALDFACGTGRISCFLEQRGIRVTAVDVSESMLAEARKKLQRATLLSVDITRKPEALAGQKFKLITAFRFFVNAEDALRASAMSALADLLSDDGVLIFNNHLHLGAPCVRLARWLTHRRGGYYRAMALGEMKELCKTSGLRLVELYPVAVLHIPKLNLREATNRRVENLLGRIPGVSRIAEDLIAVCKRA